MFEAIAELLRGHHEETGRRLERHVRHMEMLMTDVVARLASVEAKLDGYATIMTQTVTVLADLRAKLSGDNPDVTAALDSLDAHAATVDAAMAALRDADNPPAPQPQPAPAPAPDAPPAS
jgi:CRP-like cAMP-binding protein